MDQTTLLENQISDGQRLVDRLIETGIPVMAASWVKESDGGLWYLYLVTPLAGKGGGTRTVYRRINEVIRSMEEPFVIDWMQKKAFSPHGPVGRAIVEFQGQYVGKLPRWYDRASLGGVSIDAAYVYPPPVLTTVE